MRIVSRVPILMAEKQMRENRRINASIIAREAGLSRPTVAHWVKSDFKRLDEETIITLCKYFQCGLGDLLTLEDD
jgi:DNA-binding Xre family transcriptional regulator